MNKIQKGLISLLAATASVGALTAEPKLGVSHSHTGSGENTATTSSISGNFVTDYGNFSLGGLQTYQSDLNVTNENGDHSINSSQGFFVSYGLPFGSDSNADLTLDYFSIIPQNEDALDNELRGIGLRYSLDNMWKGLGFEAGVSMFETLKLDDLIQNRQTRYTDIVIDPESGGCSFDKINTHDETTQELNSQNTFLGFNYSFPAGIKISVGGVWENDREGTDYKLNVSYGLSGPSIPRIYNGFEQKQISSSTPITLSPGESYEDNVCPNK